jgi:hypothetical protein
MNVEWIHERKAGRPEFRLVIFKVPISYVRCPIIHGFSFLDPVAQCIITVFEFIPAAKTINKQRRGIEVIILVYREFV